MARDTLAEGDKEGRFVRSAATFREIISKDHPTFKPETGRYHLVISWACPWANRVATVRHLKGLEKVIGMSVVHPTWQKTKPELDSHAGWAFATEEDTFQSPAGFGAFQVKGVVPLPAAFLGDDAKCKTVRDVYVATGNDPGKYTVPLLWDTKEGTVVNNESSDLIVMLNEAFNDFAENPTLDLNPPETRDLQKELNDFIYPNINNGVYRSGFAKTQLAYDEAVTDLYASLDKVEAILDTKKYLCGDVFTLADIRLFMTLVRFDEVYVVYFKTNKKKVAEYPNIHNYCRELYQKLEPVIHMDHIKTHYFTSHPTLNHYAIIPAGPNVIQDLKLPHDRDVKFKSSK